jgi:arylsulfatase A-like enzyme
VRIRTNLFNKTVFLEAVFRPPAVMVRVALPLGFVAEVDGFLKYLQPMELVLVYAWAWVFFWLVGFVIVLAMVLPVTATARLFRRSSGAWVVGVSAWLSLSLAAFAVAQASQLWLKANDLSVAYWMGQFKLELVLAIAACSGIWVWHRQALPETLQSLARGGQMAGLAGVALAFVLHLFLPGPFPVAVVESSSQAQGQRLPNVFLITIDSLSAAHMSLYGYDRPTTPSLDRLAQQANVFGHFYANANFTTSSLNSILLGRRPWSHRVIHNAAMLDSASADHTLVARLKKSGYQTIAVTTQAGPFVAGVRHWLDSSAEIPVNQPLLGPVMVALPYHARAALGMGLLGRIVHVPDAIAGRLVGETSAGNFDPALVFTAARDFISHRNQEKPFFLWVHLLPPHAPYASPTPFSGRFDPRPHGRTRFDSTPRPQFMAASDVNFPDHYIGRYDESISYVDDQIGRFVDWLKASELFDDSMIVITADHGESFSKKYGTHGGPLLHQSLIRVPLILKDPAQRIGRRIDASAEQIDLMPTILDELGIPIAQPLEGRTLWPAIRGENWGKPIFSMSFEQSNRYGALDRGSVAMIEGRWKYVHYRGHLNYPMMPRLEDSLYDLESDPGEERNLIATRQEIAGSMLLAIQSQLQNYGASQP